MAKQFTLVVNNREPKPRSRRLRALGVSGEGANGSTIVSIESDGTGGIEGHTHANKTALDQITTDDNGYLYLSQLREVETTDPDTGETTKEWQTVTDKVKAGYADLANDLAPDSPVRQQFLSRIADDIAQGRITFQQGLVAVGVSVFQDEAQFGTFVRDLYAGSGAGIDTHGNAEFESVRVRTYFEAMEFIVNRLSAIEGDQLLTEADTIEAVDDLGNNCYGLHLKSKWDGYYTAQAQNNVLKGIINTLAEGSGTYYTSWMRVNSVNPTTNYIEVTVYPGSEVPSGTNYPPCEMMKIARWGNQTDEKRQGCIYLSSTEGRIVHLTGVTKPILDDWNYAATFGSIPEFLKGLNLPIRSNLDYAYIGGLIVQDIIRMDISGKPIVEYVDRGIWQSGGLYYCESRNPATGTYETSDVWYQGCKYRCAKNLTTTTPAWNNTDWAMIEGNPDFTVDFNDTETLFDPDRFDLTLEIIARLYNVDITSDILDSDVAWTRYSEDASGTPRPASDLAWALKHGDSGKSIHLTRDDIDFNGYMPKTVKFTATVTLRDGLTESATFEF